MTAAFMSGPSAGFFLLAGASLTLSWTALRGTKYLCLCAALLARQSAVQPLFCTQCTCWKSMSREIMTCPRFDANVCRAVNTSTHKYGRRTLLPVDIFILISRNSLRPKIGTWASCESKLLLFSMFQISASEPAHEDEAGRWPHQRSLIDVVPRLL